MIQIDLGLIGIIVGVCLTFGGMFLSAKITGFASNPGALAIVALISCLLCMIPSYGMLISIVATFFMLKQISNEGVVLMMIVSWIMMIVILSAVAKIF